MDNCCQTGDSKEKIEIYAEVMIFKWGFLNHKKVYMIANSK